MCFLVVFALHPFISQFVRKLSFCNTAKEVLSYFYQLLKLGQTGVFMLEGLGWVFRLFKVLPLFVCIYVYLQREHVSGCEISVLVGRCLKTFIEMSQTTRLAPGFWFFAHNLDGECFGSLRLAEVKKAEGNHLVPAQFPHYSLVGESGALWLTPRRHH